MTMEMTIQNGLFANIGVIAGSEVDMTMQMNIMNMLFAMMIYMQESEVAEMSSCRTSLRSFGSLRSVRSSAIRFFLRNIGEEGLKPTIN